MLTPEKSFETRSWLIANATRKANSKTFSERNFIILVEGVNADGVFTAKFVRPKPFRFVYGSYV